MPRLTIDLQEGFEGDPLVVRVDGREIFRGPARTRHQIGLAASCSTEVSGSSATLSVEFAAENRAFTFAIDTARRCFVGVSMANDGTPRLTVSTDPFFYA